MPGPPKTTGPDASAADQACLTYESYFGLVEKPFSLSPNPRFFVRTPSHAAAFAELLAGIRRREGILALTGEVGTGKTTLCHAVLESLDRKTFAAFVPDPILTREDLLKTLLVDFGVVSVDEIKAGHLRGAGRTELSYPLYEFLISLQPLHAVAVVMIDEAQNIPAGLLDEIRILSDLENGQKLLQLLLVGQPELQTRFAAQDMRQLTQRLSVRCELMPLSRADIGEYITHRLAVAGSTSVSFSEQALEMVSVASGGIPRVINLLCDRALFHAAKAEVTTVAREHVESGADDLKIPKSNVDAVEDTAEPSGPRPALARSARHGLPRTYQMRHDAHYVEELESVRQSVVTTNPAPSPNPAKALPKHSFDFPLEAKPADGPAQAERDVFGDDEATSRRRHLWLPAAAVLMLALGAGGVWRWKSGSIPPRSRVPAAQADDRISRPIPDGLPPPSVTAEIIAPQTAQIVKPVMPESTGPAAPSGANAAQLSQRFMIQMATFQSAVRAAESAQEFQAAGHSASSVEVLLRDGTRAFAVLLGPFVDRAQAEAALARAHQVPGYGAGKIVKTGVPNP